MRVFNTTGNLVKSMMNTGPVILCIFSAVMLMAGCNTASTKQTSNSGEVSDETVANNEQQVCREIEITGSRFKRKICRTAATWNAIDSAERRGTDEYTRELNERSTISPDGGGVDSSGGRSMGPATGF